MIGPTLRLQDYLQHIIEATERIAAYTSGLDRAAFLLDARTQDAVLRNLQIIGEAAQNIRRRHPDFVTAHPEVPWRSAYGMRNAVTHGYFNVGTERVWSTVENDLPPFLAQIRALLAGLRSN